MKDDLISRQAAVSRFSDLLMLELEGKRLPTWEEVYNAMQDLPSAEPTLYGYKIEHLAYIAKVMEKEGVTADYAVRTFDDMSRVIRMIIEEAQEKVMEALNVIDSIENAFKSREDE